VVLNSPSNFRSISILALLVCVCILPNRISAQVDLSETTNQNINTISKIFHDDKNTATIDQMLEKEIDWIDVKQSNLTFGLQRSTTWVKFEIQNKQAKSQAAYIEFNPIFLEKMTLYDQNVKPLNKAGSKVTPSKLYSAPTLEVNVPNGSHSYIVKLESRSSGLSMTIRGSDSQQRKQTTDLIIFSLLIGALTALFSYHLFLFISYRNWLYGSYALFVASTILFTVSFTSYHKHILPDQIMGFEVDFWWSAISAGICVICMYFFSVELLAINKNIQTRSRRYLSRIIAIVPLFAAVTILLIVATDNALALLPLRVLALMHFIVMPSAGLYLWRKEKSKTSLYYSISFLAVAASVACIVGWLTGVLPHHEAFAWSVPFGVFLQSIFLSFIAGQKLNQITMEKLQVMGKLEQNLQKLEKRDGVISAFASQEIVAELDSGENPLKYKPKTVARSIVFLDIHGYTSLSEQHSEIECHSILNDYFGLINESVYDAQGRVDKIIGDAMMLVFNNAEACLKAIIDLQRNFAAYNKIRQSTGKKTLRFGVGISHGDMLSANFGSSKKLDRTLVGDTVNVASRLESITRLFQVDILCSKEFCDQVSTSYKFLRPAAYLQLKGRSKKSLVYEAFEHAPPTTKKWKQKTVKEFERLIDLELAGEFEQTISELKRLIKECPTEPTTGKLADPTLNSLIFAVQEKVKLLGINSNLDGQDNSKEAA
jgi:class 3 adenylate cyclase